MEIKTPRDEIVEALKELGVKPRTKYGLVYFKTNDGRYFSVLLAKSVVPNKLSFAIRRTNFFKGRKSVTVIHKDLYENPQQVIKALRKYQILNG